MIFFNDPTLVPNPAERALRMAVAMLDRVAEMIVKWRKRGYDLDFGVGIAQGYATHRRHRLRGTLGLWRDRDRHQPRRPPYAARPSRGRS